MQQRVDHLQETWAETQDLQWKMVLFLERLEESGQENVNLNALVKSDKKAEIRISKLWFWKAVGTCWVGLQLSNDWLARWRWWWSQWADGCWIYLLSKFSSGLLGIKSYFIMLNSWKLGAWVWGPQLSTDCTLCWSALLNNELKVNINTAPALVFWLSIDPRLMYLLFKIYKSKDRCHFRHFSMLNQG